MRTVRTRKLNGRPEKFAYWLAVAWVLFELWYLSPLPYYLGFGILNSTEARSISLAFAVFLGLYCYPSVPRKRESLIQPWEILWALLGAFTAAYIFLFYEDLANRPGLPTPLDLAAGTIGLILLIDAARRAVALPVAIAAVGFMGYAIFGSGIGENIWNDSFEKIISHYWLTSEGVFGLPLGITVSMTFLGVVLGSGLDRLNFGDRFIGWLFCPYSTNGNSNGIAPIPRWLKGRTWTWVFGIQFAWLSVVRFVSFTKDVGLNDIQPYLIQFVTMLALLLLLSGGKSLVNFTRVRIGTNPTASIWNFCDVALIIGLFLAIYAFRLLSYTGTIMLMALPIIVFRRIRQKPDGEISETNLVAIKTEIETSVYGMTLVGLLVTSLTIVMIGIGYLAKAGNFAAAQTITSTALVSGVIVLVAIVLLTLFRLKNTDRDFLPVTLFLVIIAVLANGLYVKGLSPGLSALEAVISGLALVVIAPIANCIIHRRHTLKIAARTTLMEAMDWMSLGGRNAIPVVLFAAIVGIALGTTALTGAGG